MIKNTKHYGFGKNFLFVFFLCGVPIAAVFIKDYKNDKFKLDVAYQHLRKALLSYGETYTQLFYHLKDKIFKEKTYEDSRTLPCLFTSLKKLETYSCQPF